MVIEQPKLDSFVSASRQKQMLAVLNVDILYHITVSYVSNNNMFVSIELNEGNWVI